MGACRGRDSAGAWSTAVIGVCMFLAVAAAMVQSAQGVEHQVGGAQHWAAPGLYNTFNTTYLNDWSSTQTFVPGDSLLFTYTQGAHTVEQVSEAAYTVCTIPNSLANWTSGNDTVPLTTAETYYFICGVANHCSSHGQKLTVTVKSTTAAGPSPSASTRSSSLPAPVTVMASGALFVACISLFW